MGVFSWMKGVFSKLISNNEVESALHLNTALSPEMVTAIQLWAAMYRNAPPWKSRTVQTLNAPAEIAWRVAKLVTLEAEITLTGGALADWLKVQISPTWENIRILAEYAIAKGGLVFKPYLLEKRVLVDRVQADRIFPIAFDDNGELTGAVFVAQKTIKNIIYTRLEQHEYKGGTHTIRQKAFRSYSTGLIGTPCPLSAVPEWAEILPEISIHALDRPLFVYWKMPFANNIDDTSPLGVSLYAKAAETIEQLDRQYGRFLWEFESGERAIHASKDLFKQDKNGKSVLPKGRERLYRLTEERIEEGVSEKNLFETFSPTFRDVSLLNGFNALLRQIEKQCGLSAGTLSDPQAVEKTAEEIISTKQDSYTTVADIQKSLGAALEQLLVSIHALGSAAGIAPKGSYSVAFDWDDSILVNKADRKKQFWQYVQAGKYPFWLYLKEFEGYTEEEAKAIQAEASQGMGDPYAGA